jgi:hypothetical protein
MIDWHYITIRHPDAGEIFLVIQGGGDHPGIGEMLMRVPCGLGEVPDDKGRERWTDFEYTDWELVDYKYERDDDADL